MYTDVIAALLLRGYVDRLVVLDEIHRIPDLFQTLRCLIDPGRRRGRRTGRFLISDPKPGKGFHIAHSILNKTSRLGFLALFRWLAFDANKAGPYLADLPELEMAETAA